MLLVTAQPLLIFNSTASLLIFTGIPQHHGQIFQRHKNGVTRCTTYQQFQKFMICGKPVLQTFRLETCLVELWLIFHRMKGMQLIKWWNTGTVLETTDKLTSVGILPRYKQIHLTVNGSVDNSKYGTHDLWMVTWNTGNKITMEDLPWLSWVIH